MKKHIICWLDVIMGVLGASVFWLFIYAVAVVPNQTKPVVASTATQSSAEGSEVVEETVKAYQTNLKETSFLLSDGTSITFKTPSNFYSLTDQYLDEMCEYYGVGDLSLDNLFVVGNATSTNECTAMINVASLSTADQLLSSIYGEQYDSSTDLKSEVLTYIETGALPEELPDNYYLCELESIEIDGIIYRVFDKYYTSSYTYYEEEDTAEVDPKTIEIPYYEMVAYSDTEDHIEVIIYMVDYDSSAAYNLLAEFIGAEVTDVSAGTVICGTEPVVESEVSEDVTE